MNIAFHPGADFSRITPGSGIWISRVLHKTFVDVNEEGTEAAAATVIEFIRSSQGDQPTVMRIDRPFIFAVREHRSGTILFIGKIVDPSAQ
jgi:serpin B